MRDVIERVRAAEWGKKTSGHGGAHTWVLVEDRDRDALCAFAERHMDPPADLVETVARWLESHMGQGHAFADKDWPAWEGDARSLLAALEGAP